MLRQFRPTWRDLTPQQVLDLATGIARTANLRWIGYELIWSRRDAFMRVDDAHLSEFAIGLNSWESVDAFARTLSGPAWSRGQASDGLIRSWARSSDLWLRRAALVSTVALNRPREGGTIDPARTLSICTLLIGDREDMVVKALSWALRELGRQQAAPVKAFLAAHENDLAARVRREVGARPTTGLKNPRRG